jgi:hypothetical protein
MKLRIVFSVFITAFLSSHLLSQESAKQVFESPKLKEEISKHKTVAILPFRVSISFKRVPKNYDEKVNKADEAKQGINMQQGMYTYLLRKSKDYTVDFQETERTNAILKKNNVYDKLDEILSDSLAKILGVDAVIKCSYAYEKTGSEAGAIAKTVLFGGIGAKTASGALTMQINNGADGILLWRFYKEMNEGVFSNANELMERMMRKVARNFPYEK